MTRAQKAASYTLAIFAVVWAAATVHQYHTLGVGVIVAALAGLFICVILSLVAIFAWAMWYLLVTMFEDMEE